MAGEDLFTPFSDEIVAILRGSDQLSPAQRERVRFAITNRHDPDKVWELLHDTGLAENVGRRLIALLADADNELDPDGARALEKQALAGLPATP